ncbi:FAD binding domain-containing protein [Penicillium chermesinum]|nr:FAD binding domain-containing protein [Penicillium chermesinum]
MAHESPVIIIGGGLAGLVAAYELSKREVRTIIVDQENEASLGGQAFWSLGGLFCVNSAEQRRAGIKDSRELALQDWFGTARFDRECDYWPRKWAEAFVDFATEHLEDYVKALGLEFLSVGWAERGDGNAAGHGNSVPRFHLTWGTGPAVTQLFEKPVREAEKKKLIEFKFRHQVDSLLVDENSGAAIGIRGKILEPSETARGVASSRKSIDTFELHGSSILISSGGIGGDIELVKKNWPVDRLGQPPSKVVVGVPAHVDGRMIGIAREAGADVINEDRMWHYTEGLENWNPIWPNHGIRILPGPSSLWLDALGNRLPPMLYPGSDTLATLKHICGTGYDYSWFVLDRSIICKEFALSGSEQNPDITGKSILGALQRVLGWSPLGRYKHSWIKAPTSYWKQHYPDSSIRNGPIIELEKLESEIRTRDIQLDNEYTKDAQIMLIKNALSYWPEKWTRVAKLHKLTDPGYGPFIAVRLNILTRKSLGGIHTNLEGNVLRPDGSPFPGLYAAGEAAGFGGGAFMDTVLLRVLS